MFGPVGCWDHRQHIDVDHLVGSLGRRCRRLFSSTSFHAVRDAHACSFLLVTTVLRPKYDAFPTTSHSPLGQTFFEKPVGLLLFCVNKTHWCENPPSLSYYTTHLLRSAYDHLRSLGLQFSKPEDLIIYKP